MQEFLGGPRVRCEFRRTDHEIDVNRHAVDHVGRAKVYLDLDAQLLPFQVAFERSREAVRLYDRHRQVGRQQGSPARADLLEQFFGERSTEGVLDVEEIVQVHDHQEGLSFVPFLLDHSL